MNVKNGQNLQDHRKSFVELFEELAIIGAAVEEENLCDQPAIIAARRDIIGVFNEFKAFVKNQFDHKIKIVRIDNGDKCVPTEFERFLKWNEIFPHKTIPKTPEQNGYAERINRTVFDAVRATVSDLQLPKTFWAEAVSTAVYSYIKNRSSTSA
ncbi:Integrase catalytic core [Trinorchestia longiramus]|nr:Integrase catalytic core [Trinorchestia longiramus]